jgi:hypothetical protein
MSQEGTKQNQDELPTEKNIAQMEKELESQKRTIR